MLYLIQLLQVSNYFVKVMKTNRWIEESTLSLLHHSRRLDTSPLKVILCKHNVTQTNLMSRREKACTQHQNTKFYKRLQKKLIITTAAVIICYLVVFTKHQTWLSYEHYTTALTGWARIVFFKRTSKCNFISLLCTGCGIRFPLAWLQTLLEAYILW